MSKGYSVLLAFSPDGHILVTASHDGTARLWEVATSQPLATLKGHQGSVTHAAFSPDGRMLVTASHDGTARLWPCGGCRPPADLIADIERRVGRTLTDEERRQSGLPLEHYRR